MYIYTGMCTTLYVELSPGQMRSGRVSCSSHMTTGQGWKTHSHLECRADGEEGATGGRSCSFFKRPCEHEWTIESCRTRSGQSAAINKPHIISDCEGDQTSPDFSRDTKADKEIPGNAHKREQNNSPGWHANIHSDSICVL